jgi:hypothetical protein
MLERQRSSSRRKGITPVGAGRETPVRAQRRSIVPTVSSSAAGIVSRWPRSPAAR